MVVFVGLIPRNVHSPRWDGHPRGSAQLLMTPKYLWLNSFCSVSVQTGAWQCLCQPCPQLLWVSLSSCSLVPDASRGLVGSTRVHWVQPCSGTCPEKDCLSWEGWPGTEAGQSWRQCPGLGLAPLPLRQVMCVHLQLHWALQGPLISSWQWWSIFRHDSPALFQLSILVHDELHDVH